MSLPPAPFQPPPLPPPAPRPLSAADAHDQAARHFQQGARLHADGQREQALQAFEHAALLAPSHPGIAVARAAVLGELQRPQAAWRALQPVRELLWTTAEGAANLGTVAEQAGLDAEADAAYARALQLRPDDLRALNNSGMRASRAGRHAEALAALRRCVALLPGLPQLWAHLADALLASGDAAAALSALRDATGRHGAADVLAVRQAVAAACAADTTAALAAAQSALDALPTAHDAVLSDCLEASGLAAGAEAVQLAARPAHGAALERSAVLLLLRHAMRQGWDAARCAARLQGACDLLCAASRGKTLPDAARIAAQALAIALRLPLPADWQQRLRAQAWTRLPGDGGPEMRPFGLSLRVHADGRLRIGWALSSLDSIAQAQALVQRLSGFDRRRFAFHVYAASVPRQAGAIAVLEAAGVACMDLAHMRLAERVERIRVDGLDVLHDLNDGVPWCLAGFGHYRVARVQFQHPARQGRVDGEAFDHHLTGGQDPRSAGSPAAWEAAWAEVVEHARRGPATAA